MLKKYAYPIGEETWKQIGPTYEADDGTERNICEMAIGIEGEGEEQHFITEPFYEDLLPMIFNKKVTVHINLYSDPSVVLEMNGKMISHNQDFALLKEEVGKILDDVSNEPNRIRALTELRMNRYTGETLGRTVKILRDSISATLPKGVLLDGKKLSFDFLNLYLREHFALDNMPQPHSVDLIVRKMSKTELVNLQGEIIEYERTKMLRYSPLKDLYNQGIEVATVKEAFTKELERRFFQGEIH